jgi:hypothetical protein
MSITVFPRFSEVDVLGHVTNTALPVWFEEGRQEIFRHFSREASMRDLALILRRYEIDSCSRYRRDTKYASRPGSRALAAPRCRSCSRRSSSRPW